MSNLFPPVISGSSLQLYELSLRLVRRGHRVIVITARYDKKLHEHEVIEGIEVYRLPAIRLPQLVVALRFKWLTATFSPGNLRRIRSILARHAVDLIHLHNHMFDLAFSAAFLKRALRLPLVLSLHTPITHNNAFYNAVLVAAERLILKPLIINATDCIVCPDQNIVKYITQRFKFRRFTIIPYGVEEIFEPTSEVVASLTQRFGLSGKRIILSVGHLHLIRNRIDLIRAMPAILRHVPEAVLLIVGAVEEQQPLALVKQLGLSNAVIFTGIQENLVVRALLSICEIEAHWFTLDHPPIDSSPGIATMEAMLAGRPAMTVASEDTFGSGVLKQFQNIVLVQPGDTPAIAEQIIRLLTQRELATAIGVAGRLVALEHFAWPKVISRMEALYTTVITNSEVTDAKVA